MTIEVGIWIRLELLGSNKLSLAPPSAILCNSCTLSTFASYKGAFNFTFVLLDPCKILVYKDGYKLNDGSREFRHQIPDHPLKSL